MTFGDTETFTQALIHKPRGQGATCKIGYSCDGYCRVRELLIEATKDYVEARESEATANAYQRMMRFTKVLYPQSAENGR